MFERTDTARKAIVAYGAAMKSDILRSARVGVLIAVFAVLMLPLAPADAIEPGFSAWTDGHASRTRLVVGPMLAPGEYLAGVQIQMDHGWHTYWRNPGDSGVPPGFDFSQSGNVAEAGVEWPAPITIPGQYGASIGYLDEVVFPVVVKLEDAREQAILRLALDYAVCEEICVPLRSQLSVEVGPGDNGSDSAAGLINYYNQLVPRRQKASEQREPSIERASSRLDDGRVVLVIEARSNVPAEVFIEGPARFFFSAASGVEDGDDRARFVVEVSGAKSPDDLAGAALTATLVSANGAVEHSWTAD